MSSRGRTFGRVLGAGLAATLACVACSSSGTRASPTPPAPYTCKVGPVLFDGGSADYFQEVGPAGHACASLPGDGGTAAAASACTRATDCAPACCVCPAGTASAGQQVVLASCADEKCASTASVCCTAYFFSICNAGGIPADGGGG